jgi:hypothetical protein
VAAQFDPGELIFDPFEWSGRNLHLHRAVAAEKLANKLSTLRASYPDENIVVVGHSHGGTIAVDASTRLAPESRPNKIVTLATPFMIIANRKLSGLKQLLLENVPVGVFIIVFSMLAAFLFGKPLEGHAASFFLGASIFVGLIALIPCGGLLVGAKLRKYVDAQPCADPDIGLRLLILRASGDEASLALISAHAFRYMTDYVFWCFERASVFRWTSYSFLKAMLVLSMIAMVMAKGTLPPALNNMLLVFWILLFVAGTVWYVLTFLFLVPSGIDLAVAGHGMRIAVDAAPQGLTLPITIFPSEETSSGDVWAHGLYDCVAAQRSVVAWIRPTAISSTLKT